VDAAVTIDVLPATMCSQFRASAASVIFADRSTPTMLPAPEALADKRDRDAVAPAELQSVVGLDVEAPDRPREALRRLAHAALA